MKKVLIIVLIILALLLLNDNKSFAVGNAHNKTVIIVVDNLDISRIERILNNEFAIGIMNTKTGGLYRVSEESFFLTIATGRRVKISNGLYRGITERTDGGFHIEGYKDILNELKDNHVGFSREIRTLGESLEDKGIKIGIIGDGKGTLIAANEEGIIKYGSKRIIYENQWLREITNRLLKDVDVLVVSYDISIHKDREEILENYIEGLGKNTIYLFAKKPSGDTDLRFNSTLIPFVLINRDEINGLVSSSTTRRNGLITNLDIYPTIISNYSISEEYLVGNTISIIHAQDIIIKTRENLLSFLNLNIAKYFFHGVLIIFQLYVIYMRIVKKSQSGRLKAAIDIPAIAIALSLVAGLANIQVNLLLYVLIILLPSIILSLLLYRKRFDALDIIAIITYLLLLYGIFIDNEVIYNSYIGYNNILAGGRFYGINNDAMGVLIATSIISYYYLKKKICNKAIQGIALVIIFMTNIIALSSKYGANMGGFLTAIAILLIMLYIVLLDRKINTKTTLILIGIGSIIFLSNIYIDINSENISHAGGLLNRINLLGISELLVVIKVKLRQIMLMSISPPWSIILLSQILFLRRFYLEEKGFIEDIKNECPDLVKKSYVILMSALIAFIINDTGVISFVYINAYLINIIVSLHNIKRR